MFNEFDNSIVDICTKDELIDKLQAYVIPESSKDVINFFVEEIDKYIKNNLKQSQ